MGTSNAPPSLRGEFVRIWLVDLLKFTLFGVVLAGVPWILPVFHHVAFYGLASLFAAFVVYCLAIDYPRTSIVAFAGEPGVVSTPFRCVFFISYTLLLIWLGEWILVR